MRLATFLPPGASDPLAGEVRGDEVVAFADGSTVLDRLAIGDATPADGPAWPLDDVTLLAPVPRPGAIYGIGLNYAAHAAETGATPPEQPIVFMKVPTSVAPPGGPVRCPAVVRRLDYEGELVVVIGADRTLAGFAVADDVSARDLQAPRAAVDAGQGLRHFCPWGPWITTADEVADPEDLAPADLGQRRAAPGRQHRDLIFGSAELVAFLAET